MANHFGGHAREYHRFRPSYPAALFERLAALSPAQKLAWDCGTGNGQAAIGIAERFDRVIATDASSEQIAEAKAHPRVEYRIAAAESSGIAEASVDLVTVAQAIHWFDLDRFYAEVRRVARPRAVIAAWCYALMETEAAIDAEILRFYTDVVGPYWPKERVYVDALYRDLPFPFEEIAMPSLAMECEWSLDDVLGYVDTWSPVRIYRRQRGADPLAELAEPLARAWGPSELRRRIRFPLHFRVGRCGGSA
jgi:SAM-dependent methyltransferase